MWRRTMCAMGILLVTDILDEHRSLTNLFGKGNPLIWGLIGWGFLLVGIILLGQPLIKYIRKYLGLKRTKAVYVSKREKNRVKLDRAKLDKEKIKEAYEKRRRELDKELKEKLEKELKLKEERKINSLKDIKFFFTKEKRVMKDIEELEIYIKDLEKKKCNLVEHMEAEIEICLYNCEKYQKKMEECEKQVEEVECRLEKNKEIFKKKIKKKKAVWITVFIIILADKNNMHVTAQELKNTLVESLDLSQESQVNEPETEETVFEEVMKNNENIELSPDIESNLREHMDYNFILEDEQLHKVLDDDIADTIFLTDYPKNMTGYEQFLTDCREGKMIEILQEENSDSELGLNTLLNEIAEGLEKPFLEKINNGKLIPTQIEWEQSVPKSTELENIIDKRRQVLGMEESISVRRTIYFLLANDYQRLGKECLIQGKDDTQIYYYYGMSIYCCYCALGYERSDKNLYSDEIILNYVKARYKDIIDNVKTENLTEEVNRAEKIYSLLNQ